MFEELRDRIITIFTSRLTILWLIMVALAGILIYRLFNLQIVEGQEYLDNFVLEQEKTRDISAIRGNIYDCNGELLAYNELAYSVKIEDTFSSGSDKNVNLNGELLNLIRLIEKNGDTVDSGFGIYLDEDGCFAFLNEDTANLRFLADVYDHAQITDLTDEELASSPLEVMEHLSRASGKGFHFGVGAYGDPEKKKDFRPGDGYSNDEWLKVISLRFSMAQTAYRKYIGTTVATDVSNETIAVLLENADILPGVTIEEGTIRKYVDSNYFAHVLGYVGKASSEELENLNNAILEDTGVAGTYSSSDVVGKNGIEGYMESTLQGTKGYEKVMVDSTGKVLSILETQEATSGKDVYLSIDKDLTMAIYNIVEQKLAGLLVAKIMDAKEYNADDNSSSSDIKIPIYDVYFATINNNILNMNHFGAEDAGETEKEVYEACLSYKERTYDALREELFSKHTPYNKLSKEYMVYETNMVTILLKSGILDTSLVDTDDAVYRSWAVDEVISLGEYLAYAISMNWIDAEKLDLTNKYSDSSEIFSEVVDRLFVLLDGNTEFQKKIYKYMLLNNAISGKQICMLLYEQKACEIPEEDISKLQNGRMTAYKFMLNRITNLDITPAQLALDPCNASVVITDVNTGQVKAMVSYPGYDNNKMANVVDAEYYEMLTTDKSSPILNYATQYKAAPGSTFKIVSATAGLEEGILNLKSTIDCVSTFTAITPSPRCWNRYGHGFENVITAIRDSCNYFFYEVGYELATREDTYNDKAGIDTLAYYADQFGLSDKSGVEIAEYSPEVSESDAVRSAIGQGTNSYTTAGLARYATAIANKGTVFNLSLLDHVSDADGMNTYAFEPSVRNTVELPSEYWNAFHKGMRAVVEKKTYFSDLAVAVAGKTGTAEQIKSRPSHALFICFAPYEDPEVAMAVRIPFGYSSDYAAQVARDIIKYYYGLAEEEDLITGSADTPDAGVTNEM